MFLITARFRATRSKCSKDKPGIVYYRITGPRPSDDGPRPDRNVNSNIHGSDKSILQTERNKIAEQLRLLYCVIEHHTDRQTPFTITDVSEDFRKALAGDRSMEKIISRSKCDFPFRRDIVSVGREFKTCFKFTPPVCTVGGNRTIGEYIRVQVLKLKNENRISLARSYSSTMSNLNNFINSDILRFDEISQSFIHEYSEWLKTITISKTTQSFYLRTLRSILYRADSDGLISFDSTWFRNVNTAIDHSCKSTLDKAIDRETLIRIEQLDLRHDSTLELVRDMFMFGFYCRGMELVDIANLTAENMKEGYIIYRRRLKGQIRKVQLISQAIQIINRYNRGNGHLFPLLERAGDVMFSSVRNSVAKNVKTIGQMIGYPQLSFNMNIGTWRVIISGINPADILQQQQKHI